MKSSQTNTLFLALIIAALATLVGLTWANYSYSYQNPGGNDFLSRYVATRVFLLEGESPYSEKATQEIHNQMYGRAAHADEDQALFVYPFYTVYLMAPFSLIPDYHMARAIWMTVLEVSLIALLLISLSLARWKIPVWTLVILVFFSVFWYHGFRPLINGNPSVLVSLIIALAFLAIRSENDGLAGFLLAYATIKPQMVVLLALYVLVWSIAQRRWRLFWGFVSSLAFLIATSFLFVPNWLIENLRQIFAYPGYTLPGTPREILMDTLPGIGNQVGWAITIVMISAMIVEWRASAHKDFTWFYWTALLTLVATNLVGIPTTTENYLALFPALVLVFYAWDSHWRTMGKWLVTLSILLLFFGLWWLFLTTLQPGDQPIQNPIMFFPLPVFLFITLYWVRWWVLRPSKPLLERLRRSQKT
ncbi:MAG TPA: glycosyltransferase family 87 protein [Anaerolineales bacterium]|nr:glycosyltransferase family 87 protein [Anaerolineales bacterium]